MCYYVYTLGNLVPKLRPGLLYYFVNMTCPCEAITILSDGLDVNLCEVWTATG